MDVQLVLAWSATLLHHAGLALCLGVLAFILHIFGPQDLHDLLPGWRRSLRVGAALQALGLGGRLALVLATDGRVPLTATLRGRALIFLVVAAVALWLQAVRAERHAWPWQRVLPWAVPLVFAPLLAQGVYGNLVRPGIPLPLAWAAQALHVGAALTWLGSLFLLLAVVSRLRAWNPHARGALGGVSERFSQLSFAAISGLALTGAMSAAMLLGPVSSWAGSTYGRILWVKLGVAALMVAIAFVNRFGHVLAYQRGEGRDRVPKYARNIGREVVLGSVAVALAAWMGHAGP